MERFQRAEKENKMIRKLQKSEVAAASKFAWALCGDPGTRSYPLYPTESQLLREFEKCAWQAGCGLLGYFEEGRLTGVLSYFTIPKDCYLQTTGLYTGSAHPAAVLNALLEEMERGREAFEKYVGVTEQNTPAAEVLTARGYSITDAGREYRVPIRDFHPAGDSAAAVRVSKENWRRYAEFHDARFRNIYWSSARLLEDFNNWVILTLIRDGEIIAGLFAKVCGKSGNRELAEIFGFSAPDDVAASLLLAGLARELAGDSAVEEVAYFDDDSDLWGQTVLTDAGFTLRSSYRCWKK